MRRRTNGAYGTLAEKAVDTIRNRILDMTLEPGSRIDAPLLMKQFKLSRTPAREALNRLAAEGLVVLHANRGAYVRRLDFEDVQALFDIYFVEERMLGHFCDFGDARLVADLERIHRQHQAATRAKRHLDITRLNSEFHLRIARSSRNLWLQDFVYRIHNHFRQMAFIIYQLESRLPNVLEGQMRHIVDEHEQIIAAIRRRDRKRLVGLLASHAQRAQDRLIARIGASRGAGFALPSRGSRRMPA
ncbi:MAG: GntR family transcriptional regulator [Betaproteobacteria bacterium]